VRREFETRERGGKKKGAPKSDHAIWDGPHGALLWLLSQEVHMSNKALPPQFISASISILDAKGPLCSAGTWGRKLPESFQKAELMISSIHEEQLDCARTLQLRHHELQVA